MHFSSGNNDSIDANGRKITNSPYKSCLGLDHWETRLPSVTPTIFPLRSSFSSHPIADVSVTRRFFVYPCHETGLSHGIKLSSILTLAYSLVLGAHAGSSDEVVFGCFHYNHDRTDATADPSAASFVQNVTFDWNETTLSSLIKLQHNTTEPDSQQLFGDTKMAMSTKVASLFRTVLCFWLNPTVENRPYKRIFGLQYDDYDFVFNVKTMSSEEIEVEVQFASKAISQPEVEAFLDHFGAAVDNIPPNMACPLLEVGLATAKERQFPIKDVYPEYFSNDLSTQAAVNMVQLIEKQVCKTPRKIALQFDQGQFVTYSQLDSFANDVGHILVSHGVERGDLVGIYMDKSCEMFLAILGIHKAGGGYVPLDIEHPPERIKTIITTANIKIVLTCGGFQPHHYSQVPYVKTLEINIGDLSPAATKPDVCVTRDDISHVLFTSGSTGIPKGVVLTHGSTFESCLGSREVIGHLDGRVLQFSNYTFDPCVWDWGCTLVSGGTLCIVPKRSLIDDLGAVARDLDVTFLVAPPTVVRLVTPEEVPSFRMLVVGGELLTAEVRNKWADEVNLINIYGPTEASICVTAHKHVTSCTELSNVGKPFGQNIIYILDSRLRPVPLGCVGEIFIGGPQVARGYLGNPEQTAKVFIDDPFRPGSIMYATGDLARLSPLDHSILYVGRRDMQIKIRGQRVEIEEVESVLKAASQTMTNAAVIRVGAEDETLVAFLEHPSNGGADGDIVVVHEDVAKLRDVAHQRLPTYMLPSVYVPVNRFPLGSSGKLDRKALVAFFYAHQEQIRNLRLNSGIFPKEPSSKMPRNGMQTKLRSLWSSILKCTEDSLSVDDNFFMVGGDSISAIQLASTARNVGIQLRTTDIIGNPTIQEMANVAKVAVGLADDGDDDIDDDEETRSVTHVTLENFILPGIDGQSRLEGLQKKLFTTHGLLPTDILDVYPCTALQTSFLAAGAFIDEAYIVRLAYDIPLGSSSAKIREVFDKFINHPNGEMYRTIFFYDDAAGRFLQVVTRPSWRQMEWTTIAVATEDELEIAIENYTFGRGYQKFEYGELLTRACIFELHGVPRALVWSLHHALADHWSQNNAEFDMADVYFERSLPYRRPFKSMIRYLESFDRTAGLHFWHNHLSDAKLTQFLKNLRNSPRSVANAITSRRVHMDHTSFTRRFGITAASLVTAAWSVVIAAHTNSTDVVFGQVLSGRNVPIKNIDSMTGITINTVARRVILEPEASIFNTLLAIQRDQIEISRHEHIHLTELRSQGIPAASFFDTVLNFTNFPGDQEKFPSKLGYTEDSRLLIRRPGSYDGQDVPFGLTVTPVTTNDFDFEASYDSERIAKAEVDVILNHFECALQLMIDHPDELIHNVNLINNSERRLLVPGQILNGLASSHCDKNFFKRCDNDAVFPQTVSDLIEQQVERTPQRIALQFRHDVFMTYKQMALLSNDLAWRLVKRGVKRGHLVALYMDKSIEMFLSILAVHKAGGGYVPLDPDYPAERINAIVRLSQSAIILTNQEHHDHLFSMLVGDVVSLIVIKIEELSPSAKPDICVNRDDISHVLFTSGSTGIPKGVVLTHESTIESCLGSREVIGVLDGRTLQFSNYTFDPSVWDWGCTLASGGTLCIVPKRELMDDLNGVARSLDVRFLVAPPTVVRLIVPEEAPSFQMLVVGGELLTAEVRNRWANEVTLINIYGPTEASICVTALRPITPHTELSNIGKPYGQNLVYILDERLRPVPLGCVGEVFIGGPQIARGYLDNPELTAKAFINDPFRPGSIMYATGDLVWMSPVDHSIHYLERRDTQIKIRGQRVEIEEIESVLKAANSPTTNAAVIKVDIGNESLAAFLEYEDVTNTEADDIVIPHEAIDKLVGSLRHAAGRSLPKFMIPTIYVPLNRFPLGSSGKLDRKALAAFFYAHQEEIRNLSLDSVLPEPSLSEVPHDEVQAALRSIWASILYMPEHSLSIDDDFFMVGGDSVSAIRLTSAARGAGFSLSVASIIRNPTIRKMAGVIRSVISNNSHDDDETSSITLDLMTPANLPLLNFAQGELDSLRMEILQKHGLSPSDVLDIYPSTALQTSFFLAGMMTPSAYIGSLAWDLLPRTDVTKLQKAFDNFIDHPNGMILRTVFVLHPVRNQWLQVLVRPGTSRRMEWSIINVGNETELDLRVSEYQHNQGREPFGDGMLLTRGCIFQLDGHPKVLVWTLHHAVYDLWSLEGMVSDIERIYSNHPLPPRRPFKPMIQYLQHLDRSSGVAFWKKHLENVSPAPFPHRHSSSRPIADAVISRDVKSIDYNILVRRFGILPSTLVTCAWSIVMSAHTNSHDVVFGQVLTGRNAPIKDIESMVGVTINTVARRVLLNPQATVLATLQAVQSDQLEISKHEAISLTELESEGIPASRMFNNILNFRAKKGSGVIEHGCLADNLIFGRTRVGRGSLDYPLVLDVELVSSDKISASLFYASAVISQQEINTILDHFECALRSMLGDPVKLIHDVELINDREMRILLPLEPSTDMTHPAKSHIYDIQNVSELIEIQVRSTPQRIALQFRHDVFLTYKQMALLSNDLAWRLVKRGVKRGHLVALYMDKSIEMFLSILAVHKAGGGYVPLDPDYPAEHINAIVRLSQSAIILTNQEHHDHLSSMLVGDVVSLIVVKIEELSPSAKPDICVNRDDISHVLFTSGSTGTPKGVVLTHESTIESCLGSREVIGVLDGRTLQFSNYTFDPSVWDWGCTLASGGTLCIVPKRELMDDLNGVARSLDVDFVVTTPTVVRLLVPEEAPSIQMLVAGGELLTAGVRNRWANEVTLITVYGPTEASVSVTTLRRITPLTELSNIGKPYGRNIIYVLDEHLRPVPLGCVGEAFIGGPQLASGYLGNPEQTAKSFINDPFRPGSIVYATGDLVRMSPVDHSLHYLERRDTQIKIRGQRVEIEAVESVLRTASSAIANAAVIKVDSAGNESLVAFLDYGWHTEADEVVIVDEGVSKLLGPLRHATQEMLPTFMIPTIYVPLNRFPLMISGKLDRKALAAYFYAHQKEVKDLNFAFLEFSSSGVPHNEVQAALRSLWTFILDIEENALSIDDDFFMVGGDSISAIRLASSARGAGLSLSVANIIRNPTIRKMAQIAQSVVSDDNFDYDEIPSITLDLMSPADLPLLEFTSGELNTLRGELLPKYNLSSSDVLDIYPSTALQTSFFLAGMMSCGAYLTTNAWDLPSDMDVPKLLKAFDDFIDHPNGMMLRTIFLFHPVRNQWLQVLVRPGRKRMEWTIIDVANEVELGVNVSEYQRNQGREPFVDGMLLTRGCIFQVDGHARILVWTLHDALIDRWSSEDIFSDIERVYSGHSLTHRRSFKPMIKYLKTIDHSSSVTFWRRHLENAPLTPFPQERSSARRVITNAVVSRHVQTIDYGLLTRRFGIMPSTLVTCAWSIVLSAHTSSPDVVFGQVLTGRNAPIKDVESMTGVMINTVARRIFLNPQSMVLATLQEIQSDQLEISKHEVVSLTELESQGIPVSRIFNNILNFRNKQKMKRTEFERIFAKPREGLGRLDYPLVLNVELGSHDTISLHSFYASEIISKPEVDTILNHLECVLRFIIDHPDKLVDDVELIDDREMQLLLPPKLSMDVEVDQSPMKSRGFDLSSARNISELIELQVKKTPQRIALQFGHDVFLTYIQMNCLANDLAWKVVEKGVKRGNLVGIYMDKSVELFLSILAVHKAGGGYVPLDPDYPAERINTIVQLSRAVVILTTKEYHAQVACTLLNTKANVIEVNFQNLSPAPKPDVDVNRNDICHVLFTSGSTGVPKGVVLPHGSVMENCLGSREFLGHLNGRVLQFSNYTFDICVLDWSCTWASGGTLCIVPTKNLINDLGGMARNLDITFLGTTPTVARLIVPEEVPFLQMLLVGGEPLTPEVRDKWADVVTLVNMYGPTETGTCVTAQKRVTLTTNLLNIGRPFGRNALYILDERLRPVPLGCVGEMFIGGPQVARGYLANPEQTAKVFIDNPFRPGSTMYASGDLVRMSPVDHSIYYIGRRDTQVKVRGQRVEIGEVESVLKAASTVIENVAVIKVDAGIERLVAFLQYALDMAVDDIVINYEDVDMLLATLKYAAQQKLPAYMVPALYVPVNRFPLTSSGKLDRKALAIFFYAHQEDIRDLPINSVSISGLSSSKVLYDEVQTALRSLWAIILDAQEDSLSIDDDFFIVGGDSFSAIRLASSARGAGFSLSVADIIRNSTIRKMAQIIQTAVPDDDYDDDETPSVTLDLMSSTDLPLSKFTSEELDMFRDELLPKYNLSPSDVLDVYPSTALQTSFFLAGLMAHGAYIVTNAWDLPPNADVLKLQKAFDDFINHPNGMMLRTLFVFHPVRNQWLQVLVRPGVRRMDWTIINISNEIELELSISEYQRIRGKESFRDGELLTRGCIFVIGGQARALVWTAHHALMDHWTLEYMISDIQSVYSSHPLTLRRPFKPMIKYLYALDSTSGVTFWRKHLENVSATLFPQSHSSAHRLIADAVVSRDMQSIDYSSLIRRFSIMPSTVVTCAWSIVLSAHTGSSDVIFGQVLAGRNAPIRDVESMTGIMINTVARRVVLNHKAAIIETLHKIQAEQLEINQHESISLSKLQSEGIPASSLFNNILNFQSRKTGNCMESDSSTDDYIFGKPKEGCERLDYPLVINVELGSPDKIYLHSFYSPEIISEQDINTILDHFECALRFMINHPDKLIDDVELINDREMRLLLPPQPSMDLTVRQRTLGPHGYDLSAAQNMFELIGLQVRRTPQRIALQFRDEVFLTYSQLDSLSDDLARKVIERGVKRGNLVALYMNKSVEMFLSILAVHKAGGGYVPLDPDYPAERINTIIRLSRTAMVLTTQEYHNHVALLADTQVRLMEVDFRQLSLHASKPAVLVNRGDISHVLFTSGSTGVPKGVVLAHGSIMENCLASWEVIGRLDKRVLQFSNFTFDFSVWDWSCTFVSGGTLCILPKHELINDLNGVARSLDITYLGITPTVARLITPEQVPSLQMLAVGGELLTLEVRNRWADVVTLVNMYGPTEASTCVTAQGRVTLSTNLSNIGRPFGQNLTYVLDERLRPVPLGCIGELFIGGPQVARGYLDNPEQTAKVFINDPFRPGSIMYASGDLVRLGPADHSLYYIGRRDTQIKIRGQRVEIEEVESVLKAASSIVLNAAVVKVDVGNENLVAFLEFASDIKADDIIIINADVAPVLGLIRYAAEQRLPMFMTPTIYVPLNRFPLMTSGKLDRKALVGFFHAHLEEIRDLRVDSTFFPTLSSAEPPQNETQMILRSLWASILDIQEHALGIDDDFFIVGGDSFSAIRLASSARSAGFSLSVADIIRNSTIRKLAQIVQSVVPDDRFTDDETPSTTLDFMSSADLPLLKFTPGELDSLREELLPKYHISPSDVLDIYPSTALQTSFFLAGMMANGAYIVTNAWDLPPNTSVLKLQKAFDDFIDHPNGMMLRTVFVFHPVRNRWLQVLIRPGGKRMEWSIINVMNETELDLRVFEYQYNQDREKFNDGELLTRGCVFVLGGYARVLVWTAHHALMDHWTLEYMISDIQSIYSNHPVKLRRPFKPMVKYLQALDHTNGVEFWRRHLENVLPTPFPRERSSARRIVADAVVSRDVRTIDYNSLTRRFSIMPSTLVTCAWAIVLFAHTGSPDVVFGQVLSGRNAPITDIESMTGFMINTIARRVVLDHKVAIIETLQRIQSDQLEINQYESISLSDLQSAGIPVFKLFNSILNFQSKKAPNGMKNTPLPDDRIFENPKEGWERLDYPLVCADYVAISLFLKGFKVSNMELGSPDRIFIRSYYASELISEQEINIILDHFECALRFMINHPDKLIDDVELINDREMRLLVRPEPSMDLAERRNTFGFDGCDLSSVQNMSDLIELQVRRTPQRIALQFGHDVFLTYRQMDCLSNDLAHKLIEKGVERESLVALYMDKSIEMFLSILAIHKAGGGYVPLDPDYPAERINTVVRLSQAAIILTTHTYHDDVALKFLDVSVMEVDFRQLSHSPKPDVYFDRENICHVLFTSGSTGVPKGVVLPHRPVIENCIGSREFLGPLDGRVLQFSNYTFDICVLDWSCTLASGGTLCIVPKQNLIDDLGGVARSMDVTFVGTTPTVARLIAPEEVPSLQMLLVGGEPLTPEVRNKWADVVALVNMCGPTEAGTCVTVQRRVTLTTNLLNIGRPFGQNVLYILDERLRPVPLGCVGEMFIGGPQVARGYLANPEQTAKVFIDNPFRPGSTMYASGDLVRMSPVDHSIHYIGRRDTQIKVRGHRVEIDEIESVLKAASTVIGNAAVIKVDIGSEVLVAFLECVLYTEHEDIIIVDQDIGALMVPLRYAAQQKLPAHMVPTLYVPINRFPLTSSGKLDRKGLASFFYAHQEEIKNLRIDPALFSTLSPSEAPRDEVQATLKSLWAFVLNIQEHSLSIDDDFFIIGGDSFTAIRLASAARNAGLCLPATDIIRNPTIRKMAQIIQSAVPDSEYEDDETSLLTLDEMSPDDLTLLQLSPGEFDSLRQHLFSLYSLPSSDISDVYPSTPTQTSFLLAGTTVRGAYIGSQAWDLPPRTDMMKLRKAFEDFIDHPNGMMLRTIFVYYPPMDQWLQVLVRSGRRQMRWTVISVSDEAELDLQVSEYQRTRGREPFDDGIPLTRACIFELNGYARVIAWTLHHAIYDRWSFDGMTSDIERVYSNNPLPPRRSFKPMIKYLQRLDHASGVDFWRKHLKDALPTSIVQGPSGTRRVTADAILFRDVQSIDYSSLIRRFGIMPSTLVTCALSVVLSVHTSSLGVVFGQVLGGRNSPIRDIESMSGIMINIVARRVVLSPKATVIETLQQIQSEQLEINQHENISFSMLQSKGIPVLSLFDTILNFRNQVFNTAVDDSAEDRLFHKPRKGAFGRSEYPLSLDIDLHSNILSISSLRASEFVSEPTMNVFLENFEFALRFMIEHPEHPISELIIHKEMHRLNPVLNGQVPDTPVSVETIMRKHSPS